MKKIIVVLFLGIIIGFFIGHFISKLLSFESIPEGYVRVTVDNKSEHNIKILTLKHDEGSLEMKNLSNNESVNLIFKNGGENSYRISAILDNDSIISSHCEYVEANYRTTETIFADTIKIYRDK